ncbi:MAG: CDP-diacylglycerol--glycerol-3-phosphate 3-phosphatidyltransferase [OCS116 cluster bacterium]|uniref:CDP-diacylglycerol--glycerol-3-phosphate 3-phosphatidyltransferase n=1 Tax=OCS116 cluster bacterium TaxID=2030921 RepID=A0A2A4YY69_9PROT|nr:CDP-diacylglycerol--glycerol-3-phosphate 3-phosphatidyltransferase [OCS116 cluster bacterium]
MNFNIPNLLTMFRIVAVAAIVVCFYFEGDTWRWIALGIYVVAGITDFLDGYIARKWDMQSDLGRMLDPIADKLLISIVILMLTAYGAIGLDNFSIIPAVVILSREILMSGLREYLAQLHVNMPVSYLAKWKTTVQILSLGFLLAGDAGDRVLPYNTEIGLTLLWVAAGLTVYTGYDYLRIGIQHVINRD